MEPFNLVCPTCAAKLKVRNRSAVGQRLACPKCREMILVQAPEGHDIGASKVSAASFDDMDLDALLENRASQPSQKPAQSASPPPRQQSPVAPQKRAPTQAEMQPGENWTNPATKRKQRAILISMASIGAILVLGAIGFFIFAKGGDPTVASGNGSDGQGAAESTAPVEQSKNDLPDENAVPEKNTEVPDSVEPPPVVAEDPEDTPSATMDAPPIPGITDTAPAIPGIGSDDSTQPAPEGFGNEEPEASVEPDPPVDPQDEAARIRAFLKKTGNSISDLQNVASGVRNDFSIGTPKYFFEKLSNDNIDATKRKDQNLIGVKFDEQPLQVLMHEFASISGLSLTIQAPAIKIAGGKMNPDVTIQIENESTANVIRKTAESVGLKAIETDNGFNITVDQSSELVDESISVAVLAEHDEDKQNLVRMVQQVVWPGSWKIEGVPDPVDQGAIRRPMGTCKFENGKLLLNHVPIVIAEAQKLIDGVKAASRNDRKDSELLQPVPWIDQGKFSAAFDTENSVRPTVGQFFRSLSRDYQIKVFGDWNALGRSGWSSDSMAPGWIEEKSVGDVILEIARGMNAGLYFVDEETVWVTTANDANNIFVLRIYPLEDISKGQLSPQQVGLILSEAIGDQANLPGVSSFFLPRQQLMVLRAPQNLHRQVAAILSELGG